MPQRFVAQPENTGTMLPSMMPWWRASTASSCVISAVSKNLSRSSSLVCARASLSVSVYPAAMSSSSELKGALVLLPLASNVYASREIRLRNLTSLPFFTGTRRGQTAAPNFS